MSRFADRALILYNYVNAMGIEIEKKYRIDDKKHLISLAARLIELGAIFTYETFEENYLHRGGVLDDRPAVLRIRKADKRTTFTYKERVETETDFKHQIEFETEVSDVEATEGIIERLGYTLSIIYEKHRKAWRIGNVEVVLDELPFGYFMEIEGEINDILKVEKVLGARDLEVEARGYPRLTIKFGKLRNGVYEARFAKKKAA